MLSQNLQPESPGIEPKGIAAGPDGNLWFGESAGNRIGQVGSGVDVLTRAPSVYGAGRVGERALCDEGAWKASLDIGSYGLQWTLDGSDVQGATDGAYTPAAGDEGHQLGCRVTASPAHQLALYAGRSGTIAVGPVAVGPAGSSGGTGGPGATGATGAGGSPGAGGSLGANGSAGATGAAGSLGVSGAAATTAGNSAVLLHSRVAAIRGKRLTIRYLAARGTRLVLTVRRRGGRTVTRLASLTTRRAGRGSVSVRRRLAPGAYTLVLTTVGATSARVADAVPMVVSKA